MMLLFAGFNPYVRAGEEEPVCRMPLVIDVMTHGLRQCDRYVRIRRQWIAESPSPTPNVVLCRLAPETLHYDASRYGGLPLRYSVLHGSRVWAAQDGYVVTFEC